MEITDYYLIRKCYLSRVLMKILEGGIFLFFKEMQDLKWVFLPPEVVNTSHLRPMLLQRTRKAEKYENSFFMLPNGISE